MRILHVLDHSWPIVDGYSQRSRSILLAQKKMGWHPTALTGPLHNLDEGKSEAARLDAIDYLRTPEHNGFWGQCIHNHWPVLREWATIHILKERIREIAARDRFDVIHAHSPALCGLASLYASNPAKIPFVYEIRSFWEDGIRQSTLSPRYQGARLLETKVVRKADAVVGIAKAILGDIASRPGIDPNRLFHVPNGVDAERFTPVPRDADLEAQLGCAGIPTLGFLGTLFPWEGVAWLVQAAAALHARGTHFKMFIIGDGAEAELVRQAITRERAAAFVSYLGRVPHQDVRRYYSVLDVMVYPRQSMRLTELVTPLKPLEAMALGKAVLASSVGGLAELIRDQSTGLLFMAEDIEDFCTKASQLLRDPGLRTDLGNAAREESVSKKDWRVVVAEYASVYETAIKHRHRCGSILGNRTR